MKKMKVITNIVILFICIFSINILTVTAQNKDLKINIILVDKGFSFKYLNTDTDIVLKESITCVPLRAIAEACNFNVFWNKEDKSVTLSDKYKNIKLYIGISEIFVNEEKITLPLAPELINGYLV